MESTARRSLPSDSSTAVTANTGSRTEGLMQRFLDTRVGNHLAPDLREPREPAGDFQEAVVVKHAHVARGVPAVLEHRGGEVVAAEITLHHIWTFHLDHAVGVGAERFTTLQVDDAHHNAGQRLADEPAARSGLEESRPGSRAC